jgi:hypothetical protein
VILSFALVSPVRAHSYSKWTKGLQGGHIVDADSDRVWWHSESGTRAAGTSTHGVARTSRAALFYLRNRTPQENRVLLSGGD